MSPAAQQVLQSFEHLHHEERRELTREILRRTVNLDLPPLSGEELALNADTVFLELDREETGSAEV